MKKFISTFKKILTAPLALMLASIDDIDMEELSRAVDKRVARAEAAVLRDYFAQHGLEGEEAEQAAESYRSMRRSEQPDGETLKKLRERAENAELSAAQAKTSAEALVHMTRMGVPESCAQDVLLLACAELEKSEDKSAEAVKEAVSAVIARLPMLAEDRNYSSGSRGSFPRQNDAAAVMQHQLDEARASGDNAAAVKIISSAAAKGINLR